MKQRYGVRGAARLMVAFALMLAACHGERGWITPRNDVEARLITVARTQRPKDEWAFGQALARTRVAYVFVKTLPPKDSASLAVWVVPGKYGDELATYTSKERLTQSPHAAAGPVSWVGQGGRDLLKMAAKGHEGVVINYGLLPGIEIAPSEVEALLANAPEPVEKSASPHS